jgi:hypothetical protein
MSDEHDNPPNPHARNTDPDTSHEAVPSARVISAQMLLVLRVYAEAGNEAITDHEAYHRAGLVVEMNGARQRCTDLRHAGFIERTGDRGRTPSGKTGYLCSITQAGRDHLAAHDFQDLFG